MQRRMLVVDESSGRQRPTPETRSESMDRLSPLLSEWMRLDPDGAPEERALVASALGREVEALRVILANERAYAALDMWTQGISQVAIAQRLGVQRARVNQLLDTVATAEERRQADRRRKVNNTRRGNTGFDAINPPPEPPE